MKRIKKGDEVIIIAGASKGLRGHVLQVMDAERMLVENVNMIKRHTRPDPGRNVPGGIVEKEAPIQLSNLMLVCPESGKPTRVGLERGADGSAGRVAKASGAKLS